MKEGKKELLRMAGFGQQVDNVEKGLCAFCGKDLKTEKWKDELSKRESEISGLCQTCQDGQFTPPEEKKMPGVCCIECGKDATEAEYSNGTCSKCGGEINDEGQCKV